MESGSVPCVETTRLCVTPSKKVDMGSDGTEYKKTSSLAQIEALNANSLAASTITSKSSALLPQFFLHPLIAHNTMRTASILALATGLIAPAVADFYVYNGVQQITVDASVINGFDFFAGPPSCDDVYHSVSLSATDDASGGGVRCKGCSTAYDSDVKVTELEFNADDYGHYSKLFNSGSCLTGQAEARGFLLGIKLHWLIFSCV